MGNDHTAKFWPVFRACAAPSAGHWAVRGRPPLRRAADAFARMERPGRARDRAALCADRESCAAGRVAVLRPLRKGDQRAQAGAQCRHPRAQLPDAGNLQLRCRFCRRLAAACARGGEGRRRHHRAVRRALHGGNLEDPQSGQDRADPRPQGRLLAGILDHRRGRAAAAAEIPGRAGGRLREHVGRREGRGRHLLHLIERACRWSRASAPTP